MARDTSYGSGYKNTGMSKATVSKQKLAKAPKSVTPAKRKTATALLTKKRADLAISRSPNRNTPAAPMIGELSKMLTGVGTDSKGKFSIDPVGLAMALPLGKVVKAAAALRGAGKIGKAAALEARVAAKNAGQVNGEFGNATMGVAQGRPRRLASESLYPKLPIRGGDSPRLLRGSKDTRTFDIYADPYNTGNERVMGAAVSRPGGSIGEAAMPRIASRLPKPKLPKSGRTLQLPDNAASRFAAIDRSFSNMGVVRPAVPGAKAASKLPKRVVGPLPKAGSAEQVAQTGKQFGKKISKKEAKNISKFLRGGR